MHVYVRIETKKKKNPTSSFPKPQIPRQNIELYVIFMHISCSDDIT